MSNCDICIGTDQIDYLYEFSHVGQRTARTPHTCCECMSEIAHGQRYEHAVGRYGSEVDIHDTCALCAEIRDVFCCGNSFYYGQLWEEMNDYAFENLTTASPCFRELSVIAKEFLLERWRRWKFRQE